MIGSGGLRNGLDLAKSVMIGATMGGFARNFLSTADKSFDALKIQIDEIIRDMKMTMFLTSSENVGALRKARYFVTEPLRSWFSAYGE